MQATVSAHIAKTWESHCKSKGQKGISQATVYRLLKEVVHGRKSVALSGLDTFQANASDAFHALFGFLDRLAAEGMPLCTVRKMKHELGLCRKYLSGDFVQHILNKDTGSPTHCPQYALSDPAKPELQSACDHDHVEGCNDCNRFTLIFEKIHDCIEEYFCPSEARVAEKDLENWRTSIQKHKDHILRSLHQDSARLDALEYVAENYGTGFLICDWGELIAESDIK